MHTTRQLPRLIAVFWLASPLCTPLAIAPAAADDTQENSVTIQVSDVMFEELGRHGQFTYTREFHDLNGYGAKLRHGRVCYSGGGCNSAPVDYIVEPGGVLKQEGQLLMPTSISQNFDFTYTGENGEGEDITVKARVLVTGDQLELQEVE